VGVRGDLRLYFGLRRFLFCLLYCFFLLLLGGVLLVCCLDLLDFFGEDNTCCSDLLVGEVVIYSLCVVPLRWG